MSIFKEMHPYDGFGSPQQFAELQRMLSEAIAKGYVEEIPVMIVRKVPYIENWYREKETGEIYVLSPFNPPACGAWHRIEINDIGSKVIQ
jgi:hypothetical protein